MCGIAGIWRLNGMPLQEQELERFTDAITERGPDGSGYDYFENGTLGLGHRRLSILDLSDAGRQPMYYADGRYAITYNGEVFNFEEIQAELEARGHIFKTRTDTEIVLAAYAEWGPSCLNRFNGMWALAIWDNTEKTLFLARDRFGIKPFYYLHIQGQVFAFSSETRSFKKLPGFERRFNHTNLQLQLQGTRIHGAGHSIYENIYSILPGHYAILTQHGNMVQRRWWHIANHTTKEIPKTAEARAEKFLELLTDACKLRLISDVSVGTALSGGLDSSAVYSIVYRLLQSEGLHRTGRDSQKAFVATFPGLPSDERHYAEEALAFTGGPAVFLDQTYANLPEQIEKDTLCFDGLLNFPITSLSGIYRGMKTSGISVSMDGHGVDEMLYGYRDMLYNLYYHFYKKGNAAWAKELRNIIIPTYAASDIAQVEQNFLSLEREARSPLSAIKKLAKRVLGRSDGSRKDYQTPEQLPVLGEPYDFSHLSYPEFVIYSETFKETLPDIFRNFDLAGMMSSVEIRMPFMDWRLVSYMFSLPLEDKLGGGFNKKILRDAMQGRMAEGIRTRTHKIGIASPVEHWMNGDLSLWAEDQLHSVAYRHQVYTGDPALADKFTAAKKQGRVSKTMAHQVWQEINLHLINSNK